MRRRCASVSSFNPTRSDKRGLSMNSKLKKLLDVREGMAGEIVEGELITRSVLAWKHYVATGLRNLLLAPYSSEEGENPGGWDFLLQPKLDLGDSILVPDLAGWKEERLPAGGEADLIGVVPDWACDIVSADTVRLDMDRKLPIYARYGLPYLWLFTLQDHAETFGLLRAYELNRESGHWIWLGHFWGDEGAKVKPFSEIEFRPEKIARNLAVMGTKRLSISSAAIIRRLGAALETGFSRQDQDDEPEDDPTA
jgi:Uma2 family endonuclease